MQTAVLVKQSKQPGYSEHPQNSSNLWCCLQKFQAGAQQVHNNIKDRSAYNKKVELVPHLLEVGPPLGNYFKCGFCDKDSGKQVVDSLHCCGKAGSLRFILHCHRYHVQDDACHYYEIKLSFSLGLFKQPFAYFVVWSLYHVWLCLYYHF